MHTSKVEFMLSATRKEQFIAHDLPEVAFAGRSNVGKSSLINTLLGQKQLARVSSTPGRTQAINFFRVNDGWVFVDLPGYGYAKVPVAVQAAWQGLLESYLVGREALQGIVLIVDVRRDPMESDIQLKDFLAAHGVPVLIVATKTDKLSKQQVDKQVAAIARAMDMTKASILKFSSHNRNGRQELWEEIRQLMTEGAEKMKEVRRQKEAQRGIKESDIKVVIAGEDGSL